MVRYLKETYELDDARATTDVHAFVEEMLKQDFLVITTH